jgi:alpha-beta hydrolase superfamily lysophospholipase
VTHGNGIGSSPSWRSSGQQATAVRLPAEDDTAGWFEYADAVVDAIGHRANVILVAASMGGFTAPIVSGRSDIRAHRSDA